MEEVKTDLLVDIDNGPADKVTDLPLNLKSAGSTSRNLTSSLSTPGSSFYTSGASEGIQTSAKTKSRLSSIFLKRPTILNDDDPFDLISDNPKSEKMQNTCETPKCKKGVRTGILVSIGEDSNGEAVDGASTDWESLKFEANAIIGDIQLSSRKVKPAKFISDERKKVNFSLLSPIHGDEIGSSILNFSDSEDNSDNEWENDEELNSESNRKHLDFANEKFSPNTSIASPVKLLEFSGCDVSNIDAEKTALDYLNLSTNDITNRLSLVNLKQEEFRPRWNLNLRDKENLLDMQHLPDLVINTHHKILNDVKKDPTNTEKKVLKFNESIRRHSLFPKSEVHDPAVLYATPARTSKAVFKKPNPTGPPKVSSTSQTNATNKRVPLSTTYKHNSNSLTSNSKEQLIKNSKFDKSRRQSYAPANHMTSTGNSNANAKKFSSYPKTSTASKPPIKNTKNLQYKADQKSDNVEPPKQYNSKFIEHRTKSNSLLNKDNEIAISNNKSKVLPYSRMRNQGAYKSTKDAPQNSKPITEILSNKNGKVLSSSQKTVSSRGAERDSKTSHNGEKNFTQSSTYDLTDAIAKFHSRGKFINASTVIIIFI